jgi:hypothetical protein
MTQDEFYSEVKEKLSVFLDGDALETATEIVGKIAVSFAQDEANEQSETSFEDGETHGYSKGWEACENELGGRREDFERAINLITSDPQSASVYFHRATGKHLFEVQPCLL